MHENRASGYLLGMVEPTLANPPAAMSREDEARCPDVRETRLSLIAIAACVGCLDLIVKVLKPTEADFYHRRTYSELILILAISGAAVYFVPLARSRLVAAGIGLMVGGGIGNALSIAVFPLGVPNPFFLAHDGWAIAFNLADVCVGIGFVLMAAGVIGLSVRRRHELRSAVER
jgi:hypothetical protein